MRPPVAANGWPAASELPLTLSLARSTRRAARRGRAAPCRTPGPPTRQRAEHLRGERLVDLVVVEVLQAQAGAPACGASRRRAPSAGPRRRRRSRRRPSRRRRSRRGPAGRAPSPTPRRRAARRGRRRRAASSCRRSSCPSSPAEDRLQLRELLRRGVGAQVLVALQAEVRGDQVVQEAALVGGGEVAGGWRTASSSCSLRPIRHSAAIDRAVLAHREPRARLLVAGYRGQHGAPAAARSGPAAWPWSSAGGWPRAGSRAGPR